MALIICDTDFLIKVANDPLPNLDWKLLSKENDFVTLQSVVKELEGLVKSKEGSTSRRARHALAVVRQENRIKLLKNENLAAPKSGSEADDELLNFVSNVSDSVLATMDGSLLSRLEKLGLPYFTLSGNIPLSRPRKRATYLSSRKK